MNQLVSAIRQIISQSRESTARSINHPLALMYWHIGRVIVEDEQQGQQRATYGKALSKSLSIQLVAEYDENFSSSEQTSTNLNVTNSTLLRRVF